MSVPRKSAVLVGCGYYGTPDQRFGCEIDVGKFEGILPTFGFLPGNITKLYQPTKDDIEKALNNMRDKAGRGDVLCFYFSGLVRAGNIPAILCTDGQFITATFFQTLANQLPDQTSFTIILESSYSAGFINPVDTNDKRILFHPCQETETAKRVVPDVDNARAYGVFTEAIRVQARPQITNKQLLEAINTRNDRYQQIAVLSCIPNNQNAVFLEYPRRV